QSPGRTMKVRIRRGILVTLLGLLLLSSFAIWAAGAWVGHATAQELSVQLMAKAREAVTLRLHGDLQPAHALARLNAGLLRDGVFTLTPENRERLLSAFEVQVAHYGVDAVFVGTPDGEFWMVRR